MSTAIVERLTGQRIAPVPRVSARGRPASVVGRPQRVTEHPSTRPVAQRISRMRSDLQSQRKQNSMAPPRAVPQDYELTQVRERPQASFEVSLPKLFILSGYLVGAALVIICGLDLLFAMPFSRVNLVFDIGFLFCGAVLLYLSWDARDGCR